MLDTEQRDESAPEPQSKQCDYWTDTIKGFRCERWYCVLPMGHAGYHKMESRFGGGL